MKKYRVDIMANGLDLRYGYDTYQEAKDFAIKYTMQNGEADIFILELIECIGRYNTIEMIRG